MTTIVFMHVGPNPELANLMARSFRRHNPDARIVQVSDVATPPVDCVNAVARFRTKHNNIMLFRMQCFARLPIEGPTWFLDTDMLCNRPLVFDATPTPQAAVCVREFFLDAPFNENFRGLDFSEYAGRQLGELFPYVGCATLLFEAGFWEACRERMEALDPKYHNWWGDQEAIKAVVQSRQFRVRGLPESVYGCLPEYEELARKAVICHYKGQRKAQMIERAKAEGLV